MSQSKVKISSKGQVTIPKEFREKLGLKEGDEVLVRLLETGLEISPIVYNFRMLRGLFKNEIDLDKAAEIIKNEQKKWRL
jgi:AbrB family looped-hinge helix DNA binding protein